MRVSRVPIGRPFRSAPILAFHLPCLGVIPCHQLLPMLSLLFPRYPLARTFVASARTSLSLRHSRSLAPIKSATMSSDSNRTSIRARTIAIVGAGPSGAAAAKYLRAEKAFDKIVLFEQRGRSGGIWIYTGEQRDEDLFDIPQTNPNKDVQKPEWQSKDAVMNGSIDTSGINGTSKIPSFLSPMYEKLEASLDCTHACET